MSESKKNNNGGQILRDKLNLTLKQRLGKKGELAGRTSDLSEASQRAPFGENKTEREREFMRAMEQDAALELELLARTELFSPTAPPRPAERSPEPVRSPEPRKPEPSAFGSNRENSLTAMDILEAFAEPPEASAPPSPVVTPPAPQAPPGPPLQTTASVATPEPVAMPEPPALAQSEFVEAPAALADEREREGLENAFIADRPMIDGPVGADGADGAEEAEESDDEFSLGLFNELNEPAALPKRAPAPPSHDQTVFEALFRFDLDWIEQNARWGDIAPERHELFLIFALPNPHALSRLLASGVSFNKKDGLLIQTAARKKNWAGLDLLQKQGAKLGLDELTSVAGWRRQNAKLSPSQRPDAPPVNVERKAEQLRKEFHLFFEERKASLGEELALFLSPLLKSATSAPRKPSLFAERQAAVAQERSRKPDATPESSAARPPPLSEASAPAKSPIDLFEHAFTSAAVADAPAAPLAPSPQHASQPLDDPQDLLADPHSVGSAAAVELAPRDQTEPLDSLAELAQPLASPEASEFPNEELDDPFAHLFDELEPEEAPPPLFPVDSEADAQFKPELQPESEPKPDFLSITLKPQENLDKKEEDEAPKADTTQTENAGAGAGVMDDMSQTPIEALVLPLPLPIPEDPWPADAPLLDDETHDHDPSDFSDDESPQDDDMTDDNHDLSAPADEASKPITSFSGRDRPARPAVGSGPSALDRARLKTLDSVLIEKQALEKRLLEMQMYAEAVTGLEDERDSLLSALEEAEESSRQFESAFNELKIQNDSLKKQLEESDAKTFELISQLEIAQAASAGMDASSKIELERLRQAESNLGDLLKESERREVESARREAELAARIDHLERREPPQPEAIDWLRDTDREKQLLKNLFIDNIIKGEARTLEKIARNTSVELDVANFGLVFAAEAGQIKCAEWLLSNMGVDIHFGQELPLLRAIEAKQIDMALWLIERGANLHHADEFALRLAVKTDNVALLDKLIQAGANPHSAKQRPLREALAFESWNCFKALLAYGANPNNEFGHILTEFSESEQAMELIAWASAQRGALKEIDSAFSRRAVAGGLL